MRKFFTADDHVVPVHHPRRLMNVAVGLGADRDALLEGVGLVASDFDVPEGRISYSQYAVLERNALRLTNDPAVERRPMWMPYCETIYFQRESEDMTRIYRVLPDGNEPTPIGPDPRPKNALQLRLATQPAEPAR